MDTNEKHIQELDKAIDDDEVDEKPVKKAGWIFFSLKKTRVKRKL